MHAKFLVLPVAAYSDQFDLESEAFDKAKSLASQFESDFVIIEAKFLGVYQRVSPVFSYEDPTDSKWPTNPGHPHPVGPDPSPPKPDDSTDDLPF